MLSKTVFWVAIIFIAIIVFSFTIGQLISIEFQDNEVKKNYYNFAFIALPVAILFTLSGTIKKKYKKSKKWAIAGITIFTAIISFFLLFNSMFSVGFGSWTTETVLFRKHSDKAVTINQQRLDLGIFGYGHDRTVQLTPFLKYFQLVKEVDLIKFDKQNWDDIHQDINPSD